MTSTEMKLTHIEFEVDDAGVAAILMDQFDRLRHGDRFWYERSFMGRERDQLRNTRLSDIIRRNTSIGNELPRNVFRIGPPPATTPLGPPSDRWPVGSC